MVLQLLNDSHPTAQKIVYDHLTDDPGLAKYITNDIKVSGLIDGTDKMNYARQRRGSNHFENDYSPQTSGRIYLIWQLSYAKSGKRRQF